MTKKLPIYNVKITRIDKEATVVNHLCVGFEMDINHDHEEYCPPSVEIKYQLIPSKEPVKDFCGVKFIKGYTDPMDVIYELSNKIKKLESND